MISEFVNTGFDVELVKSLGNRAGLVQVMRTVNGKHGTYSRKQWVRVADVQPSDRVISIPDHPVTENEGYARNQIEKANHQAHIDSIKYQAGTVVDVKVRDKSTGGYKLIRGTVVSVAFSAERSQFRDVQAITGTYVTVKDANGKPYSVNLNHPKAQITRCTGVEAEEFTGQKVFTKQYFDKFANSAQYSGMRDVVERYHREADESTTFDEFIKNNYFLSDGSSQTHHVYKQKNGEYTPSRQELHSAIIETLVDSCDIPPKGEPPVCFLFGGGSASGKGSVVNPIMKQAAQSVGISIGRVDSDEIKKSLPEYEPMKAQNMNAAAFRVHEESSDIATMATNTLIEQGRCFAFDGTMKNPVKYTNLINQLHDNGYKVVVIGVDIPTEEAIKRSDARAADPNGDSFGRKVPHSIIKGSHGGFATTFPMIKDLVDEYQLYDNSQPMGEFPTLICDSSGIHNEELWNSFVKKGKDYQKSKKESKHAK